MDNSNLLQMVAALVVRHAINALAATLVTLGLVETGDQAQFTKIAIGITMGVLALAWSWWQKVGHARLAAQLAKIKSASQAAIKPGSR